MIETEQLEVNSVYAVFGEHKDDLLREYVAERNRRRCVLKHRREFANSDPAAWSVSDRGGTQGPGRRDEPRLDDAEEAPAQQPQPQPLPAARHRAEGSAANVDAAGNESGINAAARDREPMGVPSYAEDLLEEGATVVLCIPQELSLRARPNVDDVRSHMLVAAEEARGDFVTLDGRKIIIKGNQIFVGGAEKEKPARARPAWRERMVFVLYSESVEVTTRHGMRGEGTSISLKILHIDRPLRGGCVSPCTLVGMTLSQIGKYLGVLRSYPEHEPIFEELDDVVAAVQEAWGEGADSQCHENVQRTLKSWVRTSAASLIYSSPCFAALHRTRGAVQLETSRRERDSLKTQVRRHTIQVEQALEGYVMTQLHDQAMLKLRQAFAEDDAKFAREAVALRARGLSQQDLGMRPEYQCPQDAAIEHLRQLAAKTTPLEKLLCLETVISFINAAVEDNLHRHFEDVSSFQLTTDDLLDQLIFVMVWTEGLEDLMAQIYFMRAFHTMNVNTTALGYNLANVEVAALWVTNNGRELPATVAERVRESLAPSGPPLERTLVSPESDFSRLFVVVEAQNSSREVMLALQGSAGERRRPAASWQDPGLLENIQRFAASKFSPGVHAWIGRSGRVRVSTGMHHSLLSRQRFRRVACGENHMLAVNHAGQLFAWGDNRDGQVGVGPREDRCTSPMWVDFPASTKAYRAREDGRQIVVEVACGARHSMALTADQEVWSWGRATCGRLGLGPRADTQYLPARIDRLNEERIEQLAVGWSHSMAVSELGSLFVWGCGGEGRLGLGTVADVYTPTQVNLHGRRVASAAAGYAHSCILLRDGALLGFGSAAFGQLGRGRDDLSQEVLESPPAADAHGKDGVAGDDMARRREASAGGASEALEPSSPSLLEMMRALLPTSPGADDEEGSFASPGPSGGSPKAHLHEMRASGIHTVDQRQLTPRRKPFVRASENGPRGDGGDRQGGSNPLILRSANRGASCLAPQPVPQLEEYRIVSVDCGRYHSAAVTDRNEVLIWGFDEQDDLVIPEPALVRNILPGAADHVVCGAGTTFVSFSQEVISSLT